MESVSARVTRCPSCTVLRGHLSLSGATVGSVGHFCVLVTRGDHWDKRDTFLSAGDSQYPILWQIGYEGALVHPGSLSQTHPLATFSETGKFSPAKGLAQIQTQFSSVTQSCPVLCDPMDCSTPGLPVHHQLPELTQTHVHWVGDAIQPSHPLLSPSPPALNLSQHPGLFKWVSSSHQVAKVLEFQFQHQSFQWTPRTDLL